MRIKKPTLRKLRNRGLEPIRYHDATQYRHGWIVKRHRNGSMTVRLVGDDRNRKVKPEEVKYITRIEDLTPSWHKKTSTTTTTGANGHDARTSVQSSPEAEQVSQADLFRSV